MYGEERLKPSTHLLRLSTSQFRRQYKSGAVYHGEFDGNKRAGKGLFKWPNGACYDGEYMDNKRHGNGRQYFTDGSSYEGEFVQDLRHGFGQLTWPDGECYKGAFYKDKRCGKGLYSWPDGTKFEGHFVNDRKEGYGIFTFASGNIFEGIYNEDERNGPGIMKYTNGTEDIGLWLGEKLIKLCSVMESAFLFHHYSDYNVNAGCNLSKVVRRANSAWENIRNSPIIFEQENPDVSTLPLGMPETFPYLDILEGIRGNRGAKGAVEQASQELLWYAAMGDSFQVRSLLQSGCIHVDVADKTGYTALLAAAVNCHRSVINCLLDYGADVNKLNDEGLSVLAACHVLFYTKHTWKENTAESIPLENIFNTIQEDPQKGTYIHRNFRSINTSKNISSSEQFDNENVRDFSHQTGVITELFSSKCESRLENCRNDNGVFQQKGVNTDSLTQTGARSTFPKQESKDVDIVLKNLENSCSSGRTTPAGEILSNLDKNGNKASHSVTSNPIVTSLFSVLSSMTISPNLSEVEENAFDDSLKQQKQLLLAMQRRPHLEATVRLLLKRGADPNASSLPMPVLFFAVKAADIAAVEILLQKGANTSAKLSNEKLGIAPLHIAVALPNTAGIEITKLLLKSKADPDIRDSAFGDDELSGRTPLHVACAREDNNKDSCAVVQLLLEFGANPDLLCEGFSPLALAICCGNDLAVDTLLEHGADPSLKLTKGVGSALCAATSFSAERWRLPNDRIRLINKLMRAGANILAPVIVNTKLHPGTVVDYAYSVFYQDRKIAHTPYHALTASERDCYNARRKMLEHFGDLLRTQVLKKEKELIDKQLAEMQEEGGETRSKSQPFTSGILKPPNRLNDEKNDKAVTSPQRPEASRVTFRIEDKQNLISDSTEDLELADQESKDIVGSETKISQSQEGAWGSPEESKTFSTQTTPIGTGTSTTPLGRDSNCGLRISVVKAADHMSISAVATEALKMRKRVMKNRFRYCYECGRSVGVRLSSCTRCKEVYYCSKSCKLKAWNARHKEECVRLTGGSRSQNTRRSESPTPTTDPDIAPHGIDSTRGYHNKSSFSSQASSTARDKGAKGSSTKSTRRGTSTSLGGKKKHAAVSQIKSA